MKMLQTRPLIAVLTLLFCFYMIRDVLHLPADHDKTIAVQILSALTALLGFVYGYYFGATHKGPTTTAEPPKTTNKMKQVFWDITSLSDTVLSINGVTLANPTPVAELRSLDAAFEIVEDDTSQRVLTVETTSAVVLGFGSYTSTSVIADFIGSKPRRPR